MNLQAFDDAIIDLRNSIGLVFPALNPTRGGDSTVIKITSEYIVFTRNKSEKYIEIDLMRTTYLKIPLNCAKLDEIFKKQMCKKTFFLQFVKYYNLADVRGNGTRGNPYSVF